MINVNNKIDAIRRKLSHINLIIKCKKENIFTPRQRNIQKKLKRMYGSVRMERLIEMETRLKHDLSVQSKILRDRKAVAERQRINSMFYSNPKNVHREFRKEGNFNVEKTPPKEEVKDFWDRYKNNIYNNRYKNTKGIMYDRKLPLKQ